MGPETLVDALEGLDARRGASLLRSAQGQDGVAQAYLSRLLSHYGSDHGKALALGIHAPALVRNADRSDLGQRSLAIVRLLQGKWLASACAFEAAGEAAQDPVDRLSFKIGALHVLAKAGRVDRAIQLGDELAQGLESLQRPDLAARVKLNLGNALMEQDRYAEAIEAFEDSASHLQGIEQTSARLGISTAHLYGGSLQTAEAEAKAVQEVAEASEQTHLARLARLNLGHVALLRGQPDLARTTFLELSRELEDVPADRARCLEFLGDAYLRLNLWEEAADAYTQADATDAVSRMGQANLELGLGAALSGMGEIRRAEASLVRARRIYRRLGNPAWEAATAIEQARINGSLRYARAAVRLARNAASPYWLSAALLRIGGREEVEEAGGIIDRNGYAGLEWDLHRRRAQNARGEQRLQSYRRMFDAIGRGRATIDSLSSRASYLRDKADALRDFLQELLSQPTTDRTEEAIDIVVQSRSIALLDELLAVGSKDLQSAETERLRSLREELRQEGGNELELGGSRRLLGTTHNLAAIQRRWSEVAQIMLEGPGAIPQRPQKDTIVYIQTRDRIYAVVEGQAIPLEVHPDELVDRLSWLRYDLSSALLDRGSDAGPAMRGLKEIGSLVLGPVLDRLQTVRAVCADGVLWRVPWDACLAAMKVSTSLELRLHPGFQGGGETVLGYRSRVALWASTPSDLPFAAMEVDQFLEHFPDAEVYRNAEEIRMGCKGAYDLIHVIGHARQRESNPMFSSFEFGDGPLYAVETARLPFKARIAVLSACDTGSISLKSMDEPDGLARAFLARGASSVVASAWPLNDEAAAFFSGIFVKYLTGGDTVRSSLEHARSATRAWKKHPYFWGCHMLYGGYRS